MSQTIDFTPYVETKTVHRLTCFDQLVSGCDVTIEERTPRGCSILANELHWHLAEDGGVYCEACWDNIEENQRIEDEKG